MAAALKIGRHGQIFDQNMVRLRDHFDQRRQVACDEQQVDQMIAHRHGVIGRHRLRFATEQRDPFRISGTREGADGRRIGRLCAAQGDLGFIHLDTLWLRSTG